MDCSEVDVKRGIKPKMTTAKQIAEILKYFVLKDCKTTAKRIYEYCEISLNEELLLNFWQKGLVL